MVSYQFRIKFPLDSVQSNQIRSNLNALSTPRSQSRKTDTFDSIQIQQHDEDGYISYQFLFLLLMPPAATTKLSTSSGVFFFLSLPLDIMSVWIMLCALFNRDMRPPHPQWRKEWRKKKTPNKEHNTYIIWKQKKWEIKKKRDQSHIGNSCVRSFCWNEKLLEEQHTTHTHTRDRKCCFSEINEYYFIFSLSLGVGWAGAYNMEQKCPMCLARVYRWDIQNRHILFLFLFKHSPSNEYPDIKRARERERETVYMDTP